MSTSRKSQGLWSMGKGAFEESVHRLEKALAERTDPRQVFDRFREDESFTNRVAAFMAAGGRHPGIPADIARAVMGDHFFGPEEWKQYFDVDLTPEQLEPAKMFPWGLDVLLATCPFEPGEEVRHTHVAFFIPDAVAGKPLTLSRWLPLLKGQLIQFQDKRDALLTKGNICPPGWHLAPIYGFEHYQISQYQEDTHRLSLPNAYRAATTICVATKLLLCSALGPPLPDVSHVSRLSGDSNEYTCVTPILSGTYLAFFAPQWRSGFHSVGAVERDASPLM